MFAKSISLSSKSALRSMLEFSTFTLEGPAFMSEMFAEPNGSLVSGFFLGVFTMNLSIVAP